MPKRGGAFTRGRSPSTRRKGKSASTGRGQIRVSTSSIEEILHEAKTKDFKAVMSILRTNKDIATRQSLFNAVDAEGNTVLMYAAKYSSLEITRIIMDCGAQITSVNNDDETVLSFAAENKEHPDLFQSLFAEFCAQAKSTTENAEVEKYLVAAEHSLNKIMRGDNIARLDMAQQIIEDFSSSSISVLMWFATDGLVEEARELFEMCSPTQQENMLSVLDIENRSVLELAMLNGHEDMVTFLLEKMDKKLIEEDLLYFASICSEGSVDARLYENAITWILRQHPALVEENIFVGNVEEEAPNAGMATKLENRELLLAHPVIREKYSAQVYNLLWALGKESIDVLQQALESRPVVQEEVSGALVYALSTHKPKEKICLLMGACHQAIVPTLKKLLQDNKVAEVSTLVGYAAEIRIAEAEGEVPLSNMIADQYDSLFKTTADADRGKARILLTHAINHDMPVATITSMLAYSPAIVIEVLSYYAEENDLANGRLGKLLEYANATHMRHANKEVNLLKLIAKEYSGVFSSAVQHGHEGVAKALLKYVDGFDLDLAAGILVDMIENNLPLVDETITATKDIKGLKELSLYVAVGSNKLAAVKYLLDRGVDLKHVLESRPVVRAEVNNALAHAIATNRSKQDTLLLVRACHQVIVPTLKKLLRGNKVAEVSTLVGYAAEVRITEAEGAAPLSNMIAGQYENLFKTTAGANKKKARILLTHAINHDMPAATITRMMAHSPAVVAEVLSYYAEENDLANDRLGKLLGYANATHMRHANKEVNLLKLIAKEYSEVFSSAVQHGRRGIAEKLLEHVDGFDLDLAAGILVDMIENNLPLVDETITATKDIKGLKELALHVAVRSNKLAAVNSLLDKGADPNNANRGYPLIVAVTGGHVEIIRRLMQEKEIRLDIARRDGKSLTELAFKQGNLEGLKILLPSLPEAEVTVATREVLANYTVEKHPTLTALMRLRADIVCNVLITYLSKPEKTAHDRKIIDLLLHRALYSVGKESGVDLLAHMQAVSAEALATALVQHYRDPINEPSFKGYTLLMRGVVNNYQGFVEKLVQHQRYVKVNLANASGQTALMLAAMRGYTTVVSSLLKHQELDLNAKDEKGKTALSLAVRQGARAIGVVEILVAKPGIDPNLADEDGNTPLIYAAENRNVRAVELLCNLGNIDVNHVNRLNRSTALHWAATDGYTDVVRELLRHVAIKVNMTDAVNYTPLERAEHGYHTDVVVLLLCHSSMPIASVTKKIKEWIKDATKTENDFPNAIRRVTEHYKDVSQKIWLEAASDDEAGQIDAFLRYATIDVNVVLPFQGTGGKSALMAASCLGHTSVVDRLLRDPRVKVDAINSKGSTALMWSVDAKLNAVESAKKLLDAGANVNLARSRDGRTALHFAAYYGKEQVVAKLIQAGADLNVTKSDGWTALHQAVYYGKERVVAKLIQAGADLNIAAPNGFTALHAAAESGNKEITVQLLEAGADIQVYRSKSTTDDKIVASMGGILGVAGGVFAGPLGIVAGGLLGGLGFGKAVERKRSVLGNAEGEADKYLREYRMWDDKDRLPDAAGKGQYNLVERILNRVSISNESFNYGYDALIQATRGGQVKVAKLLLDKGANPNVKRGIKGETVLMFALSAGEDAIVDLLLSFNGTNIHTMNIEWKTALHYAVHYHSSLTQRIADMVIAANGLEIARRLYGANFFDASGKVIAGPSTIEGASEVAAASFRIGMLFLGLTHPFLLNAK
jgi:ankyrin repeat protein